MNGTLRGIITGLDREAGLVHAVLEDGQEIDASYLGTPPWPLAGALFTDEPASLCLGPLGHQRPVFHEDFMWGFAASSTRWDADGNWNGTTTGTGTIADEDDPGAGQAGAVRLAAGASGSGRIRKVNGAVTPPEDGQGLWLAMKVRPSSTLIASGDISIGLADTDYLATFGGQAVLLKPGSSSEWSLLAVGPAGASATQLDTGNLIAAATWCWLDIVVVADAWAAIWVDGSGPWIVTTDVPVSGAAGLTPFLEAYGTGNLDIDVVDLALVGPVNDPTRFAAGGELSHGGYSGD